MDAMAGALLDAQVDLNPHQIDAAMFATSNPLSKGSILADEVGLGKTIEAGLLIAQRWAERKRRILVITPANLRKQWHQELADKFGLPASIFEAKSFRQLIKEGVAKPFSQSGIIICSYQFAAGKAAEVKAVAWDLVVIDEAHRLRNVYKPENKTARVLKDALAQPHKVLLTATPLQNSLLELYGLVSFVDERVFGDLESFKSQFGALRNAESFETLKNRIAPICKRTLRRQVGAYVKYTKRIPLLREFTPSADETALYNHVTEYLERESLQALPNSQRQLITLVLRKLLASSTFAIAGALETLTNRLKKMLVEKVATLIEATDDGQGLIDEFDVDFETLDEIAEEAIDEISNLTRDETQAQTIEQVQAIKQEIADLESFRQLAVSITENSKGTALLQALKVAFAKLDELGAAKKAIIFTESRRTQDYLMGLLAATPYNDGVVLFNGTNNDAASKRIYADWIKRHAGTDRITGSRTADTRAALVEHFREYGNDGKGPDGSIMIATEAGAEGINLQFCSMVINYDLPWNPQRIEQRIGRCHRYGQKHDVVVVNFLNRENEADKRVYELLDQKFKLFDGVFGASDEVLGAVESGVDFERRIAEIYQTCRQPAAIHTAFEQLQFDMAGEISDAMLKARKSLLENFDEDVQERLRLRSQDAKASLGKLERLLMRFTSGALNGHAEFTDDETSFVLKATPSFLGHMTGFGELDAGRYELPRRSEDAHIYRLGHPLAQALLQHAKQQPGLTTTSPATKIVLDYAAYGAKVSVVEPLRGQHGWLEVQSLQIRSLGAVEEHLLVAAVDANGNAFDEQVTERLLNLPCVTYTASNVQVDTSSVEHRPPPHLTKLHTEIERQKILVVSDLETRNLGAFTQETEKLDAWADDLKVGLERDIKELDRRIKESRTKSKGAATLADKLAAQKEQRDLEGQRDKKRRELFDRQDEIQHKRDCLIDELERQLNQEISVSTVLICEWELT
jgi:superfamily II DNA or RNA helicase